MSSRLDDNTRPPARARRAVLVLALAAVAACPQRTRRTPDDTLVVLIPDEIQNLDPRAPMNAWANKISRLFCPGLTVMDQEDLLPAYGLAESITRVDDLTYDVTLRAGATFSDGTPVTADDVAWNFEWTIADGSKTFGERFASFDRLDARRVRFHLRKPLATLLTDLDVGIVKRGATDARGKFADGRPICAGPYRLARYEPRRILLEASPHFHGPPPSTPRLDFKVVRDATARIVMLAGGSADVIQNGVRPDLVDDVLARERLRELRGPSNVLTYVVFNVRDPVLRDVRVRRAIALAIDRRKLIERKFSGRAVLATGLLPPGHWAYPPGAQVYERDLAAAGALLDAAGYPDPDGPGGQPRLRLVSKTSTDPFRVSVVRVIAAQLAEVDVEIEVRPFELGTFLADLKKGAFQMGTIQFSDVTEPDMYFTFFHSSRIPGPKNLDDLNRGGYVNPALDRLVEAGRAELDRERRIALYAEVQRIIADELPIIPLWHEDNVAIVNRDVLDYALLPNARISRLAAAHKRK